MARNHISGAVSLLLLVLVCLAQSGCKKSVEGEPEVAPFDSSRPIEINEFLPKSGGGNTKIVIKGKNFGTDKELLDLKIGGKEAVVISVKGNSMFAIVPPKAYSGKIELTITERSGSQSAVAADKFEYARRMVVSTLCGERDEKGNYDVKNGPFDDCGGIAEPTWFSFDPKHPDILYLAQDNFKKMRVLDLKARWIDMGVPNGIAGIERMRTIAWTLSGDTMLIANDRGGDLDPNILFIPRSKEHPVGKDAFLQPEVMMQGKQCNGVAVHPVNGEAYYNSYAMGDFFRFEYAKARRQDGTFDMTQREKLFNIQDIHWEYVTVIHPSGRYAYITVINQHYILRTDYNWQTKRFGTPYVVCGMAQQAGYADGVGASARLSTPYQGVFVKNEQYVEENREDVYDYYFCDRYNHCIRKLSPDGNVTTYAGRGSAALNPNPYGLVNGALRTEARFDQPCALAYDEKRQAFYIGDVANHVIRMISYEMDDEEE